MSAVLRILHLSNELACVGNGITNVLVDLAIEQRRMGHAVTVAAPNGDYTELLRAHGVRHIHVPQRGIRNLIAAMPRLRRLIRDERPDIVHAHMVSGALAGRVAALGMRTRLVTHIHKSLQRHAILMSVGDRVITVSDAVKHEMNRRGIPASKMVTVLNGTIGSARRVVAPPVPAVRFEHPAVLTVAGMYAWKGIGDLVDAAGIVREEVPGVKVYLAGEGPERSSFQQLVQSRGLEGTVRFLGYRADAQELMRQADLFVLASHADSNPLVISEARAAGRPIVATAVGGIPEALDHGRAGVLVAPRDPGALAAAVCQVLRDPRLRERLAEAAARNLDRFDVRRVCRETIAVYRRALNEERAGPTEARSPQESGR